MSNEAVCSTNYPEPRAGRTTGVLVARLRWALARLILGPQWEESTG